MCKRKEKNIPITDLTIEKINTWDLFDYEISKEELMIVLGMMNGKNMVKEIEKEMENNNKGIVNKKTVTGSLSSLRRKGYIIHNDKNHNAYDNPFSYEITEKGFRVYKELKILNKCGVGCRFFLRLKKRSFIVKKYYIGIVTITSLIVSIIALGISIYK